MESLSGEDQDAKRVEGQILCDMLRLCGKNPKYYYFQSRRELPHVIGLFRESQYRYLHISCHASRSTISTTNDTLSYDDFAGYFKGHLRNRRLFCSACKVGNADFVGAIAAVNKGMYSIGAPACDIDFDHAAAAWATFYVSMFAENERTRER